MSRLGRFASGALAVALSGLMAAPLYAQLPAHLRDFPLASRKASGEPIAPMFNGWIGNPDGSVQLVFGFANQNREDVLDIPLGPDNKLEPARFDGAQPTHFPTYRRGGFVGIQERGVFAVTVPADMAGTEVIWTLTSGGQTYSVPGRATSTSYEMSPDPAAFGSTNPAIRFDPNGMESTDREGIYASRLTARVGEPVTLTAYVQDRGVREQYPELPRFIYPVGTEWILHQGPAVPEFDQARITGRERDRQDAGESGRQDGNGWEQVTTQATFPVPGDYVVRLRVDNFSAPDSKFDNQCCWTNAYVPVTITP
ncbi:MAG: hypothetical protein R3F41_13430 [Gammaproteobacteria bacterium]|nr:hypothetical protein [Pseudomonadales bacterium]MCP5349102.1 hypothetical protein [Pseudomonadales bacterium]